MKIEDIKFLCRIANWDILTNGEVNRLKSIFMQFDLMDEDGNLTEEWSKINEN